MPLRKCHWPSWCRCFPRSCLPWILVRILPVTKTNLLHIVSQVLRFDSCPSDFKSLHPHITHCYIKVLLLSSGMAHYFWSVIKPTLSKVLIWTSAPSNDMSLCAGCLITTSCHGFQSLYSRRSPWRFRPSVCGATHWHATLCQATRTLWLLTELCHFVPLRLLSILL